MTSLVAQSVITLFQLDTTPLGGPIFYFDSAADFTTQIVWQGQDYTPIPMQVSGFEMTTRGAIPQPSITISNLFGAANTLLREFRGLLGAKLIRIVTLRRFLDDGATPDAGYISRDLFVVAQKTSHNALAVVFKLAAQLDQEGTVLPRRTVMRDYCARTYRIWRDPGGFDYSKADCPYAGGQFFDEYNLATDARHDMCSRSRTGCSLRFAPAPLPGWFFPGVGRIK
jgi:lambda family phage minor tail protein L